MPDDLPILYHLTRDRRYVDEAEALMQDPRRGGSAAKALGVMCGDDAALARDMLPTVADAIAAPHPNELHIDAALALFNAASLGAPEAYVPLAISLVESTDRIGPVTRPGAEKRFAETAICVLAHSRDERALAAVERLLGEAQARHDDGADVQPHCRASRAAARRRRRPGGIRQGRGARRALLRRDAAPAPPALTPDQLRRLIPVVRYDLAQEQLVRALAGRTAANGAVSREPNAHAGMLDTAPGAGMRT